MSGVAFGEQPATTRAQRRSGSGGRTLDRSEPETAALAALLAPDERARADRFRFERDRRRFAVGRGLLRTLLGRTLGIAPEEIDFTYGTRGKPALARPGDTGPRVQPVALERPGPAGNVLGTGRRDRPRIPAARRSTSWASPTAFSLRRNSRRSGASRTRAVQRAAFFRGWARKEAFLKARGDGLWVGLDQFEVSIDPAVPPRVVWTAWDPDEAGRWSLLDLDVAPGIRFRPRGRRGRIASDRRRDVLSCESQVSTHEHDASPSRSSVNPVTTRFWSSASAGPRSATTCSRSSRTSCGGETCRASGCSRSPSTTTTSAASARSTIRCAP